MLEIVDQVNHPAAGKIEIDAADSARAESNLRDRFTREVDAEQMILAFDTSFKVKRLAII